MSQLKRQFHSKHPVLHIQYTLPKGIHRVLKVILNTYHNSFLKYSKTSHIQTSYLQALPSTRQELHVHVHVHMCKNSITVHGVALYCVHCCAPVRLY